MIRGIAQACTKLFSLAGLAFLLVDVDPLWAGPYENKAFLQYFTTNWVRQCNWLTDSWPVPIVANSESVATLDANGCLQCLDRHTGQTRWTIHVPVGTKTIPVLAEKHILTVSRGTATIEAYHLTDGKHAWTISLGDAPIPFHRYPSVVARSNLVYAITTNGVVTAISERTGTVQWARRLGADPSVLPVFWKDRMFLSSRTNGLHAIDARKGTTLWQHPLQSGVSYGFVLEVDALYFVTWGYEKTNSLYKIRCETGEVVWESTIPRAQLEPIVTGDKLTVIGDVTAGGGNACLVTVDTGTGRLLKTNFSPHVTTSRLYDGKFLWCMTAGQEFHIIDSRTTCPLICWRFLPAPLRIISDAPVPLFVAGKHLIAGHFKEETVLRQKCVGQFFTKADTPALLALAILIAGIIAMVMAALSGNSMIPPTHETTGLLCSWLIVVGAATIMLTLHAVVVAHIMHELGICAIGIMSMIAYALTPVGLLGGWVLFSTRFQASGVGSASTDGSNNDPAVQQEFDSLTERFRLRQWVKLFTASGDIFSPFVASRGFTRAILVVPKTLWEMCLKACDHDSALARSLLRLVIAHELTHCTTRDVLVLPFIRLFRFLMIVTIILLLGVSVALIFMPQKHVACSAHITLVLSCIVVGMALVLERKFEQAREKVADATAMLVIPPQDLSRLIQNRHSGKLSPIEALAFTISFHPPARNATQPFSITAFAGGSLKEGRVRQFASDRLVSLETRSVLLPGMTQHVSRLVFASLIAGVLYQICSEAFHALLVSSSISAPGGPKLALPDLKAMWDNTNSSVASVLWTATPILSALAACFTLILPMRDSFFLDLRGKTKGLFMICTMIVTCAILAEVVSGILSHIVSRWHLFGFYYDFKVSAIPCGVLIAAFGILMLGITLIRWSFVLQLPRRAITTIGSVLVAIILSATCCFIALSALSLTARIGLILFTLMVSGSLGVPLQKVFKLQSGYRPSEWMAYYWCLKRRSFEIGHKSLLDNASWRSVREGMFSGLISFVLPMVLLSLGLYPFLIHFDNWYVAHLPDLYDRIVELERLLISDNPPETRHLLTHYATAVFVGMTEGLTITAAEAAVWIVLTLGAVLFLMGAGIAAIRGYSSPWPSLSRLPLLARLSGLVGIELVPQAHWAEFRSIVTCSISTEIPYAHSKDRLPLMKTTCEALSLTWNEMHPACRDSAITWIRSCGAASGGFGCASGEPPNPFHSLAGLQTLFSLGVLSEPEIDTHAKWTVAKVVELQSRASDLPPACVLSYAALLLESLALVNTVPSRANQHDRLYALVECAWQSSNKTIEDTRNALVALKHLGMKAEYFKDMLRNDWIRFAEFESVSLDPKSRIEDVLNMVEVESLLYPVDFKQRPCVEHLISTVRCAYVVKRPIDELAGDIPCLTASEPGAKRPG